MYQLAKLFECQLQLQHQSFQWIFRIYFLQDLLLWSCCSRGSQESSLALKLLMVQLSHPFITTGKTIALTLWIFVSKETSLLFNVLSRLVIGFLPRGKCVLISWIQSLSAMILEPQNTKSVTVSIVPPSNCHEVMGLDAKIFIFWMLSFKAAFSLSSFTFIMRLFSSFSLSAISVVSSAYLMSLIFLLANLIPACASSSMAFCMMYSEYKLNKQSDNIQPSCTPFPIWNQSALSWLILTVAFWLAYRFLRRQVRWSGIPISLRFFHNLFWFSQSKALYTFGGIKHSPVSGWSAASGNFGVLAEDKHMSLYSATLSLCQKLVTYTKIW